MSTLLLNATYEPLTIIPIRRALSLLTRGKAQPVGDDVIPVQTPTTIINVPKVLRLVYYVNVPRRRVRWSRKALFDRDNRRCAYCGDVKPLQQLTVDHITPRSQGGLTTWENTITACLVCNRRKGRCDPQQAAMPLLYKPTLPKGNVLVFSGQIPKAWALFFDV